MKLPEWMALHGVNQPQFARRFGVPQAVVSRVCSGEHDTCGKHWAAIMRATHGEVSPVDYYPDKRRKRAA